DIYFQNVKGDGVKNRFHFTMNWNPSYSYSKLPAGYDPDNLPEHWKKLLRKPEPIEKGIPVFRNINISDVSITNAKTAIQASGMEESLLDGFSFKNVEIHSGSAGKIAFINK